MDDKVVNVSFRIWASDESEAAELSREIGIFIDEQGRNGRKVTAKKLLQAINKWKDNSMVRNALNNYFR